MTKVKTKINLTLYDRSQNQNQLNPETHSNQDI